MNAKEFERLIKSAEFEQYRNRGYLSDVKVLDKWLYEDEWVGWGEASWRFEKPVYHDGYRIQTVDETGGADRGSHASITFSVEDVKTGRSQYFRKEGYYASHYGYDWDGDLVEVKPVEKTITVYEAV